MLLLVDVNIEDGGKGQKFQLRLLHRPTGLHGDLALLLHGLFFDFLLVALDTNIISIAIPKIFPKVIPYRM